MKSNIPGRWPGPAPVSKAPDAALYYPNRLTPVLVHPHQNLNVGIILPANNCFAYFA